MHGVTINGLHNYYNLGLIMNTREVPLPKPKTETISISGMDGKLDITGATTDGKVKYDNRTIKLKFTLPSGDFEERKSEIANLFNGKMCELVFDDDSFFKYIGRCTISKYTHKDNYRVIEMSFDCEPYKREINDISFIYSINTNEKEIALQNLEMWVEPKVIVIGSARVVYDGVIYNISEGYSYPFILKSGTQFLKISSTTSNSSIQFIYTRGQL